ncbi:hypothetical protein [Traorella massiliensis]|uniref:hypothetical protein n=1 Tax=Traorella massiliensis TaxID=1903263 RepID=UPI0023538C45|nr:hypothetical protein [Traorella massiliensis]
MNDLDKIVFYMKEEINKQADVEVERIQKEADEIRKREEKKVIDEAKKEADLHLEAAKRKMNQNKAQMISQYQSDKTKTLIQQRNVYTEKLFEEAKEKLLDFCSSDEYLEYMKKKISKYTFDQKVKVYVKKEDLKLEKMFKEKLDCEVLEGNIEIGGFKIETLNQQVMDETLDSALKDQRVWFEDHSMMILQ